MSKDVEAFNKIIAHARMQYPNLDWSNPSRLSRVSSGAREPRPRQRFKRDQVKLIFKRSADWCREGGTQQQRFERAVLDGLITFLWLTGARTSEALVLRVRDVTWEVAENDYQIPDGHVSEHDEIAEGDAFSAADYTVSFPGIKRVSHKRTMVPRREFEKFYASHGDALKFRFPSEDQDAGMDGLPGHLPLFPTWDGERLQNAGKQHDALLTATVSKKYPTGLRKINGETMSLSCWRHTYASEMIESFAAQRKPNMVYFLAKNMGTSEAMIAEYYADLLPQFALDELRI